MYSGIRASDTAKLAVVYMIGNITSNQLHNKLLKDTSKNWCYRDGT